MFVVIVVLAGSLTSGAARAVAAIEPAQAADQFLVMLNELRQIQGKAPLQRDPGLDPVALDWSNRMADTYAATGIVLPPVGDPNRDNCDVAALCHRPNLSAAIAAVEPAWQSAGENVGTGATVDTLHTAFAASPGHYANMIGNYNRAGIGVVIRNERIWVTVNFLRGPALAPTTPTETSKAVRTATGDPLPVIPVGSEVSYAPSDPFRVIDTRTTLGGPSPVAAGTIYTVPFASQSRKPSGATGAIMNVTSTGAQSGGYLTVFPCGSTMPLASNVNFAAGRSVPNLVASPFGTNGNVCVFTSATTHLIIDLAGWLGTDGAHLNTSAPIRLLDSRASGSKGRAFAVSVAGVDPADATAATLNITVTSPSADGYVTAYPCGSEVPTASTVNFTANQTVPNLAAVRIGTSRSVCFFASVPVHLIVDSAGWFGTDGDAIQPVLPTRVLDTRSNTGHWSGRLGQGQVIDVRVGGLDGIPANATGAVLNVTVAGATAGGYLTVYPCGSPVPNASNLNFDADQTVANLVAVDLPADGMVCIYSSTRTHVIADIAAYV
jgi:Cysteine-rich secretory protein family